MVLFSHPPKNVFFSPDTRSFFFPFPLHHVHRSDPFFKKKSLFFSWFMAPVAFAKGGLFLLFRPTSPTPPTAQLAQLHSAAATQCPQGFEVHGPHWLSVSREAGAGESAQGLGALDGHVRPVEAAPGQQHIADESFDGGFTYQAHEEELLND